MKSAIILMAVLCIGTSRVFSQESNRAHIRVRRGNVGERYSGGIGPSSAQGVGYGGSTSLGEHSGKGGSGVVFDTIAQKAISGGNDRFLQQYQAQRNAGASSARTLDLQQQHGQQAAAAAGAAANQVGNWYNVIATGHVPSGYKGENRR